MTLFFCVPAVSGGGKRPAAGTVPGPFGGKGPGTFFLHEAGQGRERKGEGASADGLYHKG